MYQVALASLNGYTEQAQQFASTHRIPLIVFDEQMFGCDSNVLERILHNIPQNTEEEEKRILQCADIIGEKMAVAITNSGQMLFLHREKGQKNEFSAEYSLFWSSPESWKLVSGKNQYSFQLPRCILEKWLNNVTNEFELKKGAINCKERLLSSMIVYYRDNGQPTIKMISIDSNMLDEFKRQLYYRNEA